MGNLLNNINIASWNAANVSSANANRNSPLVDCSDYNGTLFMYLGSTLSGSSKIVATIKGATANSTATLYTYATVPISSSTGFGSGAAVAASRNYKVCAVDAIGLKYRWNMMAIAGATGVGAEDNFLVIQHTPRVANSTMVNQSTTVGPTATLVAGTTY